MTEGKLKRAEELKERIEHFRKLIDMVDSNAPIKFGRVDNNHLVPHELAVEFRRKLLNFYNRHLDENQKKFSKL